MVDLNKELSNAYNTKDFDTMQKAYNPGALLMANSNRVYAGTDAAAFFKSLSDKQIVASLNLTTQFIYEESATLIHAVTAAEDKPDGQTFYTYTRWINPGTWQKAFEVVLQRRPATADFAEKICLDPVVAPTWLTALDDKFGKCLNAKNGTCAQSLYHVGALELPPAGTAFVHYEQIGDFYQNFSKTVTFSEAAPTTIYKESDSLYHELGVLVTDVGSSAYYNRWVQDPKDVWSIAVGIGSVLPGGHC